MARGRLREGENEAKITKGPHVPGCWRQSHQRVLSR